MTGFPGRLGFAKDRVTPPILQAGQIVILEKLSVNEEGFFTVFDSARSDDAEEMAELLREEVDSPAELATLDELRSKAVHQKVILKLSSVKTMIAKTEGDNRTIGYFSSGREFVSALGEPFGEDPSDEEAPDDDEVAYAGLEGTGIQRLPVTDRSTAEGIHIVESGRLDMIDGLLYVVEDGSGRRYETNSVIASMYIAPKVEPCCELAPFVDSLQLRAALARMPSSAKLPPGKEGALRATVAELQALGSKLFDPAIVGILDDLCSTGDSAAWSSVYQSTFRSFFNGKRESDFEGDWPTEPASLGVALRSVGRRSVHIDLEDEAAKAPAASEAIVAKPPSEHPYATALLSLCGSEAVKKKVVEEALMFTELNLERHPLLGSFEKRRSALNRFLVKNGVSFEFISGLIPPYSASQMYDLLADIEANPPKAPASSRTVGAPCGSSSAASSFEPSSISILVDKADEKGSEDDRIARATYVEFAKRVADTPALLAHMNEMADCVRFEKHSEFQKLLEAAPSDIKNLIAIDIENTAAPLSGKINSTIISIFAACRSGIDYRIYALCYPGETREMAAPKLLKAISAARMGRLAKLDIGAFAGSKATHDVSDPLMAISKFPASDLAFMNASVAWQRVSLIAFPEVATEVLAFFGALQVAVSEYRASGAPWSIISLWFREVMLRAEAPSKKLLRGQGLSGPLVCFDSELIDDRTTKWHQRLQRSLIQHLVKLPPPPPPKTPQPQPAKPAKLKAPKAPIASPSAPPAASPAPAASATPGAMPSDVWAAASEKLKASNTGKAVDGKSACYTYFIKGSCARGAQCPFHHNGLAGAFRPKGY